MNQWATEYFEKLAVIESQVGHVYRDLIRGTATAPASIMGPRTPRFEFATPLRVTGAGAHITDPAEIKARKGILGGHIKELVAGRLNLTPQEREAVGSEAMGRFHQSIQERERTITPTSTRQATVTGRKGVAENAPAVTRFIERGKSNRDLVERAGGEAVRQRVGHQVPTPSQAAAANVMHQQLSNPSLGAGLPQLSPSQAVMKAQGSTGPTQVPKPHPGGRFQVPTPSSVGTTMPPMKKGEFWATDYCKQADIPMLRSIWSVLADKFKQDDEPDAPKTQG